MNGTQLVLEAGEVHVAATHLDAITAGGVDATPDECRRAAELVRAGVYRATVVLRRLQAQADAGRVDIDRLVLLVVGILAGLLLAGVADWVTEAPPERPRLPVVAEVEPGIWACLQEGRAVPCHFGDGGDTFERSGR